MVAAAKPIDAACEWCGAPMPAEHWRGKRRFYCSRSCAQRARGASRTPGECGGRPQLYYWTPDLDDQLRRRYDGRTETISALAQRLGFPRWNVKRRALVLGLARSKEPRWTAEQDDWLRAHLTRKPWRALAAHLGRTIVAVKIRAKRLHLNKTAGDESFTARAAAQVLGVDDHKIARWVERGLLAATRRGTDRAGGQNGDFWRVAPRDLRTFILRYPQEVDLRRVEGSGSVCVADPRLEHAPRPGAFRVVRWGDAAPTVTGGEGIGRSCVYAVADARLDCAPRNTVLGVLPWGEPAGTVIGSADVHAGAAAVADPRIPADADRPDPPPVIVAEDGTWHRPLTPLELAVLQGLPVRMPDGRPLQLAGRRKGAWLERIGNAVPAPAAQAIAETIGRTLLAVDSGMSFILGGTDVWVERAGEELRA